ncbi:Uncharacterized protein Fot_03481 [Forsythia ovata]|uniref:Uncharacterized protein n=1 Tax=Forsythia ovata TaxID=205694 RepID=A0ABD1X9X5_9LAMI
MLEFKVLFGFSPPILRLFIGFSQTLGNHNGCRGISATTNGCRETSATKYTYTCFYIKERIKVSSDCLELRAWFHITLEDYNAAIRDIQALLTLEPNYMMFQGKVIGSHLVELLSQHINQWSPADCWMQLYDRWSSVDDVGSLAVIHQMLINNPGKSILWFRESLLLLR